MSVEGYYYPEQMQLNDSIFTQNLQIAKNTQDIQRLLSIRLQLENLTEQLQYRTDSLHFENNSLIYSNDSIGHEIEEKIKDYGDLERQKQKTDTANLIANEQRNKANTRSYLFGGALIVVFILFVIVLLNWLKRRILSETNNQLSHFGKNTPFEIKLRQQKAITKKDFITFNNEQSKLVKMADFFDAFYNASTRRKNKLKDEIELFKILAEIEFNENNIHEFTNSKIKIQSNVPLDKLKIPTFTIFNILYNSFKRGKVFKSDRYIDIKVLKNRFSCKLIVQDNGEGVDDKTNITSGTGLKFVKLMVRAHNLLIFYFPFYCGTRRDKQRGYEVSFSLLNLSV
ncbi:hypothetical protein QQ054_04295 [Oscillatoria amoena NRMC-F 0135]|nr:hypothetical protein [Oscillatoria amoena NRMC-F 0135]